MRPGDKPWLVSLLEVSMKTMALEASSLALSTAALGRAYEDRSLIQESARLYGRGLSELQRALSNPRLALEDKTLATCLTLSMYELMECPAEGTQAYASHCKGLQALVQSRGPHAHASGFGRQLFLATRLQAVCSCAGTTCSDTHLIFCTDSVCNGTPLSDLSRPSCLDGSPVQGMPKTTHRSCR